MREPQSSLSKALTAWWRQQRKCAGMLRTFGRLLELIYEFLRDSLPDRRRQRYGDIDYDWEQRVNTTGATLSWGTRLLGLLNSPYQPIPPEQFREMMSALSMNLAPDSNFSHFTFIDIGAGKGRALLLASEFGFRRIIGVELLPELVEVAHENVAELENRGIPSIIELKCGDAVDFVFPGEPCVVFLFNPLPESPFRTLLENLETSLREQPRPMYVVYANPVFEQIIGTMQSLTRLGGNDHCSLFSASGLGSSGV